MECFARCGEHSWRVQAEMMELKASRSRDAEAVVVEARMDKGQGPIATVCTALLRP